MANDWIKIRKDLPGDPNVASIAAACDISIAETVLALLRFWSWADSHSVDGKNLTVSTDFIDDHCRVRNLSRALRDTNWLMVSNDTVSIPNFDVHLSQSAKRRAVDQKRKDKWRKAAAENSSVIHPKNVTAQSGQNSDQSKSKSKKEKSTSLSLAQKIYEAYPRHVGKAKAIPAIEKAIETIAERGSWMKKEAGTWLLCRVQKFADSPAGKRGTFTPHPTTWMNGGRYDDDDGEWQKTDDGTTGRSAAQGSQQRSQDGGRQRRADKSGRELVGDPGQAHSL